MAGHEIAVPIIFFLSMAGILITQLYTRHKERMSIIEKGLNPQDAKALYERASRQGSPLTSLKWGIVFVGIGAAVLLGIWLHETYGVADGAMAGLIALMGGVGLIVFYAVARKKVQP